MAIRIRINSDLAVSAQRQSMGHCLVASVKTSTVSERHVHDRRLVSRHGKHLQHWQHALKSFFGASEGSATCCGAADLQRWRAESSQGAVRAVNLVAVPGRLSSEEILSPRLLPIATANRWTSTTRHGKCTQPPTPTGTCLVILDRTVGAAHFSNLHQLEMQLWATAWVPTRSGATLSVSKATRIPAAPCFHRGGRQNRQTQQPQVAPASCAARASISQASRV